LKPLPQLSSISGAPLLLLFERAPRVTVGNSIHIAPDFNITGFAPLQYITAAFAPTLPLSKPVSDRRSRDAAAGYGGNDHIVRAHTAAGTEQRGAPPPTQCMFTRRTIEEARRGGASLSEQRGHGGAANQRRHG
jgi:hypothetical protein